jgi:S-DNA-T family DNA segregation ATPase FtsK/SpoIIIE
MELGFGRDLFARFAADDTTGMVALLEDAVAVLDIRARELAGVTRLHEPTIQEPLIVVAVDELASLTAYCPDRKLRDRASAALSLLLSKGRAVGVVVVAAVQDPSKQVVDMRQLFTTRVALRADTPSQVDMVLGEGMCTLGAPAHRIPESTPGVGYVKADGVREPVRVRAAWVSDEQVRALAARYMPAKAGEQS